MAGYGVTGIGPLKELAERFGKLASARTRQAIGDAMAEAIKEEIDRQFVDSRDPQGGGWAPLLHDYGKRKGGPLRRTDKLRKSVRVTARGLSVDVRMAKYGLYHNEGTVKMDERNIVPYDGRLGKWKPIMMRAASRVIKGTK